MLKSMLLGSFLICAGNAMTSRAALAPVQRDVTLSGTAETCFNTTVVPVSGVSVGFYNVVNARPLIAHLDSMTKFPGFGPDGLDTLATNQFDALETTMQRMALRTRSIFRRTSGHDGTFSVTISPVDSVLVLGFENMEDEPYVYAYKIMSGTRSSAFILDMSRGQCGL
jgi:hypothetical protein